MKVKLPNHTIITAAQVFAWLNGQRLNSDTRNAVRRMHRTLEQAAKDIQESHEQAFADLEIEKLPSGEYQLAKDDPRLPALEKELAALMAGTTELSLETVRVRDLWRRHDRTDERVPLDISGEIEELLELVERAVEKARQDEQRRLEPQPD